MSSQSPEKKTTPCPRCSGTGICADCQGQGFIPCIACEGVGSGSSRSGQRYTCKTCNGTGRIACTPQCPSCNGQGFISSSFQAKVQEKYRTPSLVLPTRDYAVKAIIATCVVVYLLAPRGLPSLLPEPLPTLFWDLMIQQPNSVYNGEYWRFITPTFLHGGLLHLVINMYALYSIGPNIESLLGSKRFLLLYLFSALTGSLLSWMYNTAPSVGASGAIFGVASAYVGLHYRYGCYSSGMVREIIFLLVGFLVFGFAMQDTPFGFIDNWGHLGGGLGGLLLSYAFLKPSNR